MRRYQWWCSWQQVEWSFCVFSWWRPWPDWNGSEAGQQRTLKSWKENKMMFIQFWLLRFPFVVAVILIAFSLIRCLAWILDGKYRTLPLLGWLVQRGMPLNYSVDRKGDRTIRKGLCGNQLALTLPGIGEFPGCSGQPSRNKPGWGRLGHTKAGGHCS